MGVSSSAFKLPVPFVGVGVLVALLDVLVGVDVSSESPTDVSVAVLSPSTMEVVTKNAVSRKSP